VLSEGARVARLADTAGLHLDDWEEWVLDQGLGRDADRKWSALEVALIVARQNGKGAILEALSLAALFLDDFGANLILHSAHEFKTAAEAFRRIEARIDANPTLKKRVKQVHRAAGQEAIELRNRKRLRFIARSKASGIGFTADLIILDEAWELSDEEMRALMFTLSARPNPQLWYTSTAGTPKSTKLGSLRKRGIEGDPDLFFAEWSAGEKEDYDAGRIDLDDPEVWAATNPGMGIRISEEFTAKERSSFRDDPWGFASQRLSVGDYPLIDEGWQVIPLKFWEGQAMGVPAAPVRNPLAFAVDASPGQRSACIAVASWVGRGVLVEISEDPHDWRPGIGWVTERVLELRRRHRPRAGIVIDPRGPASGLIQPLEAAGVEVIKPTLGESAQAFAQFTTGVFETSDLWHLGQAELQAAVKGAARVDTGDGGHLWARKDTATDICPLVAATLAQWALRKYGRGYDIRKSIA